MPLEDYKRKRNFSRTSEPKGKAAQPGGHFFTVQKHDATRLHYDFRLEMDGVLKSWAVTRGPSLVAGEKRLAVHVEDHPLEYGDFEGTIPKGEYGGGTVVLWDCGTWAPISDEEKGYAKGHLEFELKGQKLQGKWNLVRMHGKPGDKRENWLLIKAEDEFSRPESAPDILEEKPNSVKTGRNIAEVAGKKPGWSSKTGRIGASPKKRSVALRVSGESAKGTRLPNPGVLKNAKKAVMLPFIEPMLATLVSAAPAGEQWIHEIKFDGYRLQVHLKAGQVKFLTRGALDWTRKFGSALYDSFKSLPIDSAIFDGELVVETGAGSSSFSSLQSDLSEGRTDRFIFYVFDIMYLDGYDLRDVTLAERKNLTELLIAPSHNIRFSDHFSDNGEKVLRHACKVGLEGIVSKVSDAPYRSGRSKSWLKSKCSARQEFVIGGYVLSTVSDKAIGSLVLGVYENGKLRHVGRVGTGFGKTIAEELFSRLQNLRSDSHFSGQMTTEERRHVEFVRPELVAEVEFRAWTADGHLRHASFLGLREDKVAKEIIQETPASQADAGASFATAVKFTHPDRVYWPDKGITKMALADYYSQVWAHMEPFVVDRPLALLRAPAGITGESFFQKHAWNGINSHIKLIKDPATPNELPLVCISDLDGLLGLVQSACLEIHPWGSILADWERPDVIVMDLDPGENVTWDAIADAAEEVKARLSGAGLEAFVKTSGGKGLHVVSPLLPKADWRAVKAFSKSFADAMAADSPDRFVSTISKAKRGGKILIDYLRNQRGQTAVACYSTRARPGAPVSAPISWQELRSIGGASSFNIENMPERVETQPDPWAAFRSAARPLEFQKTRRKRAG